MEWGKLNSRQAAGCALAVLMTMSLAMPAAAQVPRVRPDAAQREARQEQKEAHKEQRQQQRRELREQRGSGNGNAPAQNARGARQMPDAAGPRGGDWLKTMQAVPQQQRMKTLEQDPQFRSLAPEVQQRMRDRLEWFNSRTPEEQQRIVDRLKTIEEMTPAQRQLARRYQGLPDERRAEVHKAINRLRGLSPEEQQRVMSSEQFRNRFSDQEREIIGSFVQTPEHAAGGEPPELQDF